MASSKLSYGIRAAKSGSWASLVRSSSVSALALCRLTRSKKPFMGLRVAKHTYGSSSFRASYLSGVVNFQSLVDAS